MTGEPDLVLELQRHYDAPVERVYQAWTDLDVLTTWWGCAADMLWEVHEYDVRIGGALRVSMPIEGATFEVVGEFLAVDPPHHLSYSFGDEVVDVRIEPDGAGSLLTLRHEQLADHEAKRLVTDGWTDAVRRLGEGLMTAATPPVSGGPG